jgi:hypothetical protein
MYYKQYEQHLGEEGWYVYFKPANPEIRAIKEAGPMKQSEAEAMVERRNHD